MKKYQPFKDFKHKLKYGDDEIFVKMKGEEKDKPIIGIIKKDWVIGYVLKSPSISEYNREGLTIFDSDLIMILPDHELIAWKIQNGG